MLSSITAAGMTATSFICCILVAVALGIGTSLVFSFKTRHTASMALTLAIMPAAIALVIMLVNGNVGAGGDGAFTPTRIGSVPVLPLLDYIEAHSVQEVRNMCSRSGGFVSFFGTSDAKIVHRLVE